MNTELKKSFLSNLKTTIKLVGAAFLALSTMIIFDSIKTDDNEGLLFPFYLFAFFSPVMLFGVYLYTVLRASSLNKYLCSLIFGASISACTICLYLLLEVLHYQSINLRFVSGSALVIFVCLSGIYLQLPWRKNA